MYSMIKNEIVDNAQEEDDMKSTRSPFRPRLAMLTHLEERPTINVDLGNPFYKLGPVDPSNYVFERLKNLHFQNTDVK
jgi:hypothetical protein